MINFKVYCSQIFNIFLIRVNRSMYNCISHSRYFYTLPDIEYSFRGHSTLTNIKSSSHIKLGLDQLKMPAFSLLLKKLDTELIPSISLNHVHSIRQWLRLEGTSGCHLVQYPCSSRATWSDCWRLSAFKYLQEWRLHKLSEKPVPMLGHPHSKKTCFLMLRQSLLCFSLCPLSLSPQPPGNAPSKAAHSTISPPLPQGHIAGSCAT